MSNDRMDISFEDVDWGQWLQEENLMTANEAPPPHISPAASKGRDEYMNDVSNPNHLRPDDNMIIDSAAPGAAPMAGQVGMVDWTAHDPDILDQELMDMLYSSEHASYNQDVDARARSQAQALTKRPRTISMDVETQQSLRKRALRSDQEFRIGSSQSLRVSEPHVPPLLVENLPVSNVSLLPKSHTLSSSIHMNEVGKATNTGHLVNAERAPPTALVTHTSEREPPLGVPEGFCNSFKVSRADGPKGPKERGKKSCLRCHIQKIKCSGSFPCTTCQRILDNSVAKRSSPALRWTACFDSDIKDLNIFVSEPTQAILSRLWPTSRGSLDSNLCKGTICWIRGVLNELSVDQVNSYTRESAIDRLTKKEAPFLSLSAKSLVHVEVLPPEKLSTYMASLWYHLMVRRAYRNVCGSIAFLGAFSTMYLNVLQILIERARRKRLHCHGILVLLAHLGVLQMLLKNWTTGFSHMEKVLHLGAKAQHLIEYIDHLLRNFQSWCSEKEIKVIEKLTKDSARNMIAGEKHISSPEMYFKFDHEMRRYISIGLGLRYDLFYEEDRDWYPES